MAEQILDQVRSVAEGQIDFQGQKLAEFLGTGLLVAVGVLSFLFGYVLQDIKLALFIGLGGAAATLLIIVPPWPFYNKHPIRWLPSGGGVAGGGNPAGPIIVDDLVIT